MSATEERILAVAEAQADYLAEQMRNAGYRCGVCGSKYPNQRHAERCCQTGGEPLWRRYMVPVLDARDPRGVQR